MPDSPTADDPVRQALAEHQAALEHRPDLPAMMTTAEVAAFLAVSHDTVHRYVHKGSLPAFQLTDNPSAPYRYKRQDVLDFLEGRAAKAGCGCHGDAPRLDELRYDPAVDGIPPAP